MDNITEADFLRALQEARRDGAQETPPQMLRHLNRARALFKAALQSEQPAVRSAEAAAVLGLSKTKMRDVIRHLHAMAEIETTRVVIVNAAGASQPVPAYKWIERSENDQN